MTWHETTAPVALGGQFWTHVGVADDQILLARLRPSGVPEKVCRLSAIREPLPA